MGQEERGARNFKAGSLSLFLVEKQVKIIICNSN